MLTKTKNIVQYIEGLIENKVLSKNDQIPSFTDIMKEHGVSRDTVVRAYKKLNNRGIIKAVQGKGYFVTNEIVDFEKNVFLLLDELSHYKNTLVKSIERNLKNRGQYRIFFHHYDSEIFNKLIEQNLGQFTHYAISPFPNSLQIKKTLEQIPEDRLILLDRHDGQDPNLKFIGQEFLQDITVCLGKLENRVEKYRRFIFIFPELPYYPSELKIGFQEYCIKMGIESLIVPKTSCISMRRHDAYLVINDSHLARIVERSRLKGWRLGSDIGVISYNETPLKSVVAEGITTISTDFKKMGEHLVCMIFDSKITNIHNASDLILRNSF